MTLVIMAQDIKGISFGLLRDGAQIGEVEATGEPDQYLQLLDAALKVWNIGPADLTRIVVVSGPGAFTASRVSTTIANSIAFTRRIPLVAIANPKRLTLEQLIGSEEFSTMAPVDGFAVPTYDRPPHITLPKKRP